MTLIKNEAHYQNIFLLINWIIECHKIPLSKIHSDIKTVAEDKIPQSNTGWSDCRTSD